MMGLFRRQTVIDQLLYPELLGGLFFLNAPQIFQKPWALVKNVIDPATRQKIFMLGGPKSYEPIFKAGFPPETLPDIWGGLDKGHHISVVDNPRTEMFERMYHYTVQQAELVGHKGYAKLRMRTLLPVKLLARKCE